ncbi:MAG: DUF2281 domain-containing protein [Oscillospiraceae bacterium]|nr:DUF2281 domain-containing protein [Oscillospiraceae bacterium]
MELRQQLHRDIELLPESVLIMVSDFISLNTPQISEAQTKRTREEFLGCMRGQFNMAEDFDAPLDDFKEYMP